MILTGCMPQAFPEEAKAQLDADIVFSNKSDGDIFSIINRYHTEKSRIVDINAHQTGDPFAPLRHQRLWAARARLCKN